MSVPCAARVANDITNLVLLQTVLKDVLNDQASSLPQRDLMPHATKSLIHVLHDLRRRLGPAQLKEFLPDVTSIAVDDGLWDAAEKFVDHDGLVILGHRVKCLLHHVAAEGIHGEVQRVAPDGFGNLDHLLRSAMLKAALDQKVAETVDHQGVGLGNNCLHDVVLLLGGADLELLLKKDRSLLIVVTHNLVHDVLPIAGHVAIEQTTVIEGLRSGQVSLALRSQSLKEKSSSAGIQY